MISIKRQLVWFFIYKFIQILILILLWHILIYHLQKRGFLPYNHAVLLLANLAIAKPNPIYHHSKSST